MKTVLVTSHDREFESMLSSIGAVSSVTDEELLEIRLVKTPAQVSLSVPPNGLCQTISVNLHYGSILDNASVWEAEDVVRRVVTSFPNVSRVYVGGVDGPKGLLANIFQMRGLEIGFIPEGLGVFRSLAGVPFWTREGGYLAIRQRLGWFIDNFVKSQREQKGAPDRQVYFHLARALIRNALSLWFPVRKSIKSIGPLQNVDYLISPWPETVKIPVVASNREWINRHIATRSVNAKRSKSGFLILSPVDLSRQVWVELLSKVDRLPKLIEVKPHRSSDDLDGLLSALEELGCQVRVHDGPGLFENLANAFEAETYIGLTSSSLLTVACALPDSAVYSIAPSAFRFSDEIDRDSLRLLEDGLRCLRVADPGIIRFI